MNQVVPRVVEVEEELAKVLSPLKMLAPEKVLELESKVEEAAVIV